MTLLMREEDIKDEIREEYDLSPEASKEYL